MQAYTVYNPNPITVAEATSQGWTKAGTCIDGLGLHYEKYGSKVALYYTAGGQVSGVRVYIEYDDGVKENLVHNGFFTVDGKRHYAEVGFRNDAGNSVCDASHQFAEPIGTSLTVSPENPSAVFKHIPLAAEDATAMAFHKGSTFDGMGTHYFYDISDRSGSLSWYASELMPLVPMYHPVTGKIQAIFVAATSRQQTIFPPSSNGWEPVPLVNAAMCQNLCDHNCAW